MYDSSTGTDASERGLDQRAGSWIKPSHPAERVFLTAVGPGLPTFAAYEPYSQDVFSVHDSLVHPVGEPALPDGKLSYLVAGWYSDSGDDILKQAAMPPAS
ncbi:hypothetical protein [Embleya sp. NPDC056538]|uniref:hypothetical protein n=1 Tax=Embleya sp. NPDC056538 TaxID=3345858 RepID=UPI0036B004E9